MIGFPHASQDQTKAWADRLDREFPNPALVTVCPVAVLEAVPRLVRGMASHGIKSGTPRSTRPLSAGLSPGGRTEDGRRFQPAPASAATTAQPESATCRPQTGRLTSTQLQAKAGDLTTLVGKIMDLVMPAPKVRTCASNLAARTTPEYAAFPQWLQREIWAAPAIFVDSKAFLYTRLKGAGVDWLIRSSRG